MEVKSKDTTRELHELEYTFTSGAVLPLMVDMEAGDTVEDKPDVIYIKLVAKPSISNPEELLAAETITIFKSSLAAIQSRVRTLRLPTIEEKEEIKRLIHAELKGVQ